MTDDFSWSEALDLVRIIRSDPSSQLAASVEGWDYPLDRVGWILSDLIDVQGSSKAGKKWKNYRRPIKDKRSRQRFGNLTNPETGKVHTRSEVVEILNRLGHSLPV